MSLRGLTRAATTAALAVLLAGCSGKGPHPVEGVVLLDGKPLDGATITCTPEGPGQPSVASTAADGSFKLSTQAGSGAMPGSYRAVVTKVTGPERPKPPWLGRAEKPPTKEEMAEFRRHSAEVVSQQKEWVPKQYRNNDTTPLRFTVPTKEKLRWELKSDGDKAGS